MSCIGNLLWLAFAGIWLGLGWAITGVLWCCTIVGIPVGVQCFKFALLALAPFGRDVRFRGGAGSVLLNVCWLVFGGLALALASAVCGVVLCCTIIGIPFGMQCFKLAQLALMPFGSDVY